MTAAAMLPTFQRPRGPRPLPDLDLPAPTIEVDDRVTVLSKRSVKGWTGGVVVKLRPGAALVDETNGQGRHWHDLDDLARNHRPGELIEDYYAERPPTIVIPCGRAKLDEPAAAGDLYTGSQHRLARQAADRIAADTGGRVVILSALHGLVDLDRVLEPYDVTIGDEGAIRPDWVRWQLVDMGARTVIALTPNGYTDLLRSAGRGLVEPLAGSVGIGEQRGRLARLRDHGLDPAALAA